MMYLPRLCEHCLNPACVASCPSSSIYKREEDGIVLIDQDKCPGLAHVRERLPVQEDLLQLANRQGREVHLLLPAHRGGPAHRVQRDLRGRSSRYLGVLLYDADRIQEAASVERDRDLYQAQLDIFLDPHDPAVIAQAKLDGIADNWIEAAQKSPVYKMAVDWKIALPLHPEYRTLPMVWYVPPLSPITSAANAGHLGVNGEIPDVGQLRIPVQYLANLLTAGDTAPVIRALERMLAMRSYQRSVHVDKVQNLAVLEQGRPDRARRAGHVPGDGHCQLRRPLRHPQHAPRVRRKRLRHPGRLRFLVWQRLLGRLHPGQHLWQQEKAHRAHQGHGVGKER